MKAIIEAPNDGVLSLGRQGENLARRVKFKLPPNWDMSDPAASVQLVVQRAEESTAYPVMLSCEDGVYYWDVTAADTGRDGYGLCELRYLLGDVLAKSMTWITSVAESISDDLTEPPDAAQNYLSQVMAEGAKAASAADRAESTVLKMPYIEDGVWMCWDFDKQAYVSTGVSAGGGSGEGTPGAVFTPHLADNGDLSWTNNGDLDNPETVNIMGPPGEGTPGGYYTPAVSQPDANTMRVEYLPSQDGMAGVKTTNIVLPQGSPGSDGKNAYQYAQDGGYTGSETEFAAKLAAEHLPVPAAAAVGQYFKAKSVNETGAVTEVEAVDSPDAKWELIVDYTATADCSTLYTDVDINGNAFDLQEAIITVGILPVSGNTSKPNVMLAINRETNGWGKGVFNMCNVPNETETKRTARTHIKRLTDGTLDVISHTIGHNNTNVCNSQILYSANEAFSIDNDLDYKKGDITAVGIVSYTNCIGNGSRIKVIGVRK